MKSIKDQIEELQEAGIIDWKTGDKIRQYYRDKPSKNKNRILIFFGILGATLVGLGIILIIAHNWDKLSIATKSVISFLPLLLSQAACIYTKTKKDKFSSWKEGAAVLLFFSIGASIAMISQVYQIDGDIHKFLVTWALLGLPIIFLMPSSAVSIITLLIVTRLRGEYRDSGDSAFLSIPTLQILMYGACLIYYLRLVTKEPRSLFTGWHHYLIPIVGLIIIFTSSYRIDLSSLLKFIIAFGLIYNVGKIELLKNNSLRWNPYLTIGALGTVITFFIATYQFFWIEAATNTSIEKTNFVIFKDPFFYVITAGYIFLFANFWRTKGIQAFNPIQASGLVFGLILLLGIAAPISGLVLCNLWIALIGLYYFQLGNKKGRLTLLNFGMLILASLILARFFEVDLSFVYRGICFVIIGLTFFGANYYMIKKSKSADK